MNLCCLNSATWRTKVTFSVTFLTDTDGRTHGIIEAPKLGEISQGLKSKYLIKKGGRKRKILLGRLKRKFKIKVNLPFAIFTITM